MRNRRVTARSERAPDGSVRTVYRVGGVPIEDTETVASILDD
jgi:hypothetical protein